MLKVAVIVGLFALACGGRIFDGSSRIAGGEVASIEDNPYQVSIQDGGLHVCGGALIRADAVVTSASCTALVKDDFSRVTVRAGTATREEGGQVAKVASVCDHPRYNLQVDRDYDISVLKLESPLELGSAVQPIELQPFNVDVPVGTLGRVSGWGGVSKVSGFSKILRATEIPKIGNPECKVKFPSERISIRMNCYGFRSIGKHFCDGDVGGPLVVDGKLAGVASWGYSCGKGRYPNVFTSIANGPINSHIQQCLTKF